MAKLVDLADQAGQQVGLFVDLQVAFEPMFNKKKNVLIHYFILI